MRSNRIKRIETDITIGVTAEIKTALAVATDFLGMTPSQLGRQAILEKLCREGFMRHPGFNYQNGISEIKRPAE